MYSNGYIFRYAAILVVLAAAFLSLASVLLKPFQERNKAIDKMEGILSAARVEGVNANNAIPYFDKYIVDEQVVNAKGEVVNSYTQNQKDKAQAFNLDMKVELYNKAHNKPFQLPVYIAEKEGQKIYIFPMRGTGLWGAIWGNIALSSDLNTVIGVYFGDASETPGLGGEIKSDKFKDQFIGKKIFDNEGKFTSIEVVKGGIQKLPAGDRIHGVDALSGATLTSNGVNDMLKNVLGIYLPYIEKNR
ncbi:MAG: NADH:ubiquinone reductase (Na(+)-transporting) subunit C [Bacteroidales bacterium]|nr:NADH:ubiquinone reductase (Na(+)-transporting) subunit C [Bacteroidales bacterium]